MSLSIRSCICLCCLISLLTALPAVAREPLRILTWKGYVTEQDLKEVNRRLEQEGYAYEARVITPYAEGAAQMFDIIRRGDCDIAFLTLFFIKMEQEQTAKLLKPIDVNSPRLSNYRYLDPKLTHLPIGMVNSQPLYIPWGGGIYGFYIDRSQVPEQQVPVSVGDLWKPEWKSRFSLNSAQPWYNVGLALMEIGQSPFHIYHLARAADRNALARLKRADSLLQQRLTALYGQAGHFWAATPEFRKELLIVSSWGPEIARENARGGDWRLITFREGNQVWLDTINFVRELEGRKLEAAEIVANYFIGKQVQERIVRELSMVAVSTQVESNPVIDENPDSFRSDRFVPPYDKTSYMIMKALTDRAAREAGVR